jgi:hypothetical protein
MFRLDFGTVPRMDTFFSILGDNEIDEEEYTTVYQAYGISKDNCITAFRKISGVSITSFNEISGVRFLYLWNKQR